MAGLPTELLLYTSQGLLSKHGQFKIPMCHLQHIYVPSSFRHKIKANYLYVAANNCNSMTRLCIDLNYTTDRAIRRPIDTSLPLYLAEFPLLDGLSIVGTTSNPSITSILDVCHQLTRLSLKGRFSNVVATATTPF
jgi:hypothetical protein